MKRVLDWLAMGGVLSARQLGVNLRSMADYVAMRLVSRVSVAPSLTSSLSDVFQITDGREKAHQRLFCLGVNGEQIVQHRFPFAPLTGYQSYTDLRILHDLILNEIVFRLAEAARQAGWRTFWAGTNAAEIRAGSEQLIEPDALLILERGEERKAFAIEYHNEEDKRQRAFDKVRRYERARQKTELWTSAWQVETFPPVLAVFRDNAVGLGYRDAVRELNAQGTYYGKSLEGIAKGVLQEWLNVRTEKRERLF
ncbi:MAG: replication-relaxation family protein [Chloroflexota bacterium]